MATGDAVPSPAQILPTHASLKIQEALDPDQNLLLNKIQDQLNIINQEISEQETLSKSLIQNIEVASADRIRHLPFEIQREHDAVATEIADLNWHLSRAKRKLNQVNSKKERCELLHDQLNESIKNVDKHAPMVEDKLVLEQKEMEEIEEKQAAADVAYKKVKKELDDVIADFNRKIDKLRAFWEEFSEF